jgi:hypothetical protein
MLPYPVIITWTIIGLAVISFIVLISTGNFFSFFIVLSIAALVAYLLRLFGVLDFKMTSTGPELDFHENAPAPKEDKKHEKHLETKEVFFIEGNQFTYNDAPAVCAAYGAELASYDQLTDAFAKGAEWCGYGWSAGGMALFPTQESTWAALQQEQDDTRRTACGRPGVNGGYFDPSLKFGVNCFGLKPGSKGVRLPAPLPGTDTTTFDAMVAKFKKMMHEISLSPFNRNVWSQSNELKFEANQAQKKAGSFIDRVETDIEGIPQDIGSML